VANTRTSTSRKPRTAARAASRPSRPAPEPDEQDVDEQQPTAAETEAESTYVTAELCGEELQIIPPGSWRASWQALLNQGQIADFIEHVLHPADLDAFWEIDPVNSEFYEFIEDAARQAGESLGKSRGPGRSSQRTRRR
jgi:hypothetical protein